MCQWIYPAVYREHKYLDLYTETHFGLLDVILPPDSNGSFRLVFRAINFKGEEVIHKQLDIDPTSSQGDCDSDSGAGGELECLPIHGRISSPRWLLYRAAVALPLLVLVVCPVLAVLWLFFAASWYVLVGQELKRRADVEAHRARLLAESGQ